MTYEFRLKALLVLDLLVRDEFKPTGHPESEWDWLDGVDPVYETGDVTPAGFSVIGGAPSEEEAKARAAMAVDLAALVRSFRRSPESFRMNLRARKDLEDGLIDRAHRRRVASGWTERTR